MELWILPIHLPKDSATQTERPNQPSLPNRKARSAWLSVRKLSEFILHSINPVMGISVPTLSLNSISNSRMGKAPDARTEQGDGALCVSYLHRLVLLATGVFLQGLASFRSPSLWCPSILFKGDYEPAFNDSHFSLCRAVLSPTPAWLWTWCDRVP